jgi:hypothetical protein
MGTSRLNDVKILGRFSGHPHRILSQHLAALWAWTARRSCCLTRGSVREMPDMAHATCWFRQLAQRNKGDA